MNTDMHAVEQALRERMQAIARAELERKRSRLGRISREQERAVEQLLITTVEQISTPIVQRAREYYASGEIEKARTWCSILA